ncbi:N-acetyldiaminopimelate deacetylase [Risungbinella massiliensis]|uniref:N-acetyldiaminopimelate deacetylase n=1 Tax=Risungbinella massiliensis TaxID=1329796 RepID=UPI0005CBB427|nr:N-acetyldiaminopimelate deacetylase [Risungbinella massiliensis]
MRQSIDWIQIRRDLHQIPEPGFKEYKTQAYLLEFLAQYPTNRMEVNTWRTGLLVKVKGTDPAKTIGYRTDMDGLPLTESTSYDFASKHPGFMHACGHDLHMTIALGILDHFVHHPIQDDLVFLFQPAEEGPGGAEPMLASNEFAMVRPDEIYALHIAPEYPVGTIALRSGVLFANTCEVNIDLKGTSGHAAYPHRANDMVVAAAHLVTQLQTIISRNVDPIESAVLSLGKLHVGTAENIIADSARLEGTIRSLSIASMDTVKRRIQDIVHGVATAFGAEGTVSWGSSYCQVFNHHKETEQFLQWTKEANPRIQVLECPPAMTGEDFGYFLKEIPGFLFWLGVQTPYSLHHPSIEPNEEAISVAINLMTQYLTFRGTHS